MIKEVFSNDFTIALVTVITFFAALLKGYKCRTAWKITLCTNIFWIIWNLLNGHVSNIYLGIGLAWVQWQGLQKWGNNPEGIIPLREAVVCMWLDIYKFIRRAKEGFDKKINISYNK